MVMKNSTVTKIIIAVVVILVCIPIISDMISNSALKTIKYDEISDTVSSTANYNFALIYVAPKSSETTTSTQEEIKEMMKNYQSDDKEVKAYYVDYEALSTDEVAKLFGASMSGSTTGYIFAANGEQIRTETNTLTNEKLSALVSEYSVNGLSEDETYYKVVKDAAAFKKLVNRKKTVTMAIFGRSSCYYCNQFQPVYNTVAEENGVDMYYFNSDTYDKDEYQKVLDSGLVIPASCADKGEDIKIGEGFSTPLTLFTRNGKVIDCISGYVNKATLVSKLETLGLIETEE